VTWTPLRPALALAVLAATLMIPAAASAQAAGSVGVGVSISAIRPVDGTGASVGISPVARLNPGRGWGIAGALAWYDTDLVGGPGEGVLSLVRVRPFMLGPAYSVGHGRVRTTFSVVAGYSANSARDVRPAYTVDVGDSFAVRPGVDLTYSVAPRLALIGFGGYLVTRPEVTIQRGTTRTTERWRGDAVVLSAGVVVSPF
jgi:hypothetical protein